MDVKQGSPLDETRERVILAVTEIAKGIKIVSFYPARHPALTQAIGKIISTIEAIPPPESGIEIDVTKNSLLYQDEPFPARITSYNVCYTKLLRAWCYSSSRSRGSGKREGTGVPPSRQGSSLFPGRCSLWG